MHTRVHANFLGPDAFVAPSAFAGRQLAGARVSVGGNPGVTMKIFDWKRRQSQDGRGEIYTPF